MQTMPEERRAKMFMVDRLKGTWWYTCDICGKESKEKKLHEKTGNLSSWKVGYYNIHLCPKHRSKGDALDSRFYLTNKGQHQIAK